MFDRLESIARNPHAVRLLKAEVYLRPWSSEAVDDKAAAVLRGKAPSILESLVREASGFERRKAIATLATLRFNEGDDAKAAALYRAYVDAYPDSPYAWVAALRAAECEEPANAKQAALMFRAAARRFGANPFARVLGHAYAGRALEAAGDFRLSGTRRHVPTAVMQTPNQPPGAALDVQAFWKQRFFVEPGHWGGWVLETYPIINEIEFVDAARSRASVRVTFGHSGATVLMEKMKDGTWVAKTLTNFVIN